MEQILDISSLVLEISTSVMKSDGSPLADTDYVPLANVLSNSMFKSCAWYYIEQSVENNSLFKYHIFIKLVTRLYSNFGDYIFLYRYE